MRAARNSIARNVLETLRQKGVQSDVIDARIQWSVLEGIERYLRGIQGETRVYPTVLPTQASGRWSFKDPPLTNFSEGDQRLGLPDTLLAFCPDPNEVWVGWDYEGVESRLFVALAEDIEDIEAFARGWDMHTLLCCDTFGLPRPTNYSQPHTAPEDAEWRARIQWGGKEDKRRTLAKNIRFGALQYGIDERAVLQIPNLEDLGLTRATAREAARRALAAKPAYTMFKQRTWGEAIERRIVRTWTGRRRWLFPSRQEIVTWQRLHIPGHAAKAGLNHCIQGGIVDLMNRALIRILTTWPAIRLVYHRHDEAMLGVPKPCEPREIIVQLRPIIEEPLTINGRTIPFPANFKVRQ